jgi:hypothetical protein
VTCTDLAVLATINFPEKWYLEVYLSKIQTADPMYKLLKLRWGTFEG